MNKLFRTLLPRSLFRDKAFLPTTKLLLIFLLPVIPTFIASFFSLGWMVFVVMNFVLLIGSFYDFVLLPKRRHLNCVRSLTTEVERGIPYDTTLTISNQSSTKLYFQLIDNLPDSFTHPITTPFPLTGSVDGTSTTSFTYTTLPSVRGDYKLDKVYFRYRSRLNLWERRIVFSLPNTLRVIPDLSQVKGHLASAQKHLIDLGSKVKHQRIGSGEFAHIRTYVPGDDPRKINWRQTAKQMELMTNVYEPEHGKYVTLLIDCGRPMGVELTKTNKLEQAVEAALSVAAIALQKGDYVSVVAFSSQVKAFVPPGKRLTHLRTIINAIYNVTADTAESDYPGALLYLENMQKRHGLLLLFSDLEPFMLESSIPYYLQRVSRKYNFLLLGIADPTSLRWIKAAPSDTTQAMIKTTAQREALFKKHSIRRWARLGIQLMEVSEDKLAAAAISRYIEIINRAVL